MVSGPNVQLPSPFSPVSGEGGTVTVDWQTFFQVLQQGAYNLSRSGPTADRPTSTVPGRWVGMPFYDTTLGFPVYLAIASTNVWHDGQGNVV